MLREPLVTDIRHRHSATLTDPLREPRRVLPLRWPNLRNARDLGGIPTMGGGRIRDRAPIRIDNRDRLDAVGLAALRSYRVTRIIDLRWQSEALKHPSPLSGDHRYRLVPACFDPTGDEEIPLDSFRLMADAKAHGVALLDPQPCPRPHPQR